MSAPASPSQVERPPDGTELLFYPEDSMAPPVSLDLRPEPQEDQEENQEIDDSLCTIEDFKRRGLIIDTEDRPVDRSLECSPLTRRSVSPIRDLPSSADMLREWEDESGYPGTVLTCEARLESVASSSTEDPEAWWDKAREGLNYPTEFEQFSTPTNEVYQAQDVSQWLSAPASQPVQPEPEAELLDWWGFPVIAPSLDRVDPDTGKGLSVEVRREYIHQWRMHSARMEQLGEAMIPEWEALALQGASNEQVSRYARHGLPQPIRAQVWRRLCAVHVTREPGEYQKLLKIATEHPEGNIAHQEIEKDVERTFPEHEQFRPGMKGVEMLRHVLNAYSLRNPGVGYCQGMNYACALLLVVLEEEEEAYWALSALVEGLVPNYFDELIIGSVVDQCVLASLLQELFPKLAAQMEALGVELPILCMQWFNSLFIETMPFSSVVCVWDALLSEGALAIMRIGLAIFERNAELIESSDCLEQLIVGVRTSLSSSFDGLALLEAAYSEGTHSSRLTQHKVSLLRKVHEHQVRQSLSRCGVPWKHGKLEAEGDQEGPEDSRLSLPASMVQSLSEAAAEIYAGRTTRGDLGAEHSVRHMLFGKVGDVAAQALGGLSSLFFGDAVPEESEGEERGSHGESALVATNTSVGQAGVFSSPSLSPDDEFSGI